MADSSTSSPVVDIRSFEMRFGAKDVIKDLSFAVNQGEVFGFLGANGAGKTTTIRTLLSLLEPTGGTLLVHGKRYDPSMTAMVGYLPEERGLYRNEPILDTMVYFAVLHGLKRSDATARALAYLDRVGLGDKAKERLINLSNGQQQKIQLGVTILHEPSLMILDEPTASLDPVNRSLLMDLVSEQRAKGATVMLVTHRMEEVEQLCDRILIMKDGVSAAYGTVNEVKDASGAKVIEVAYTGTLPQNDALYAITSRLPHSAELAWKKNVAVDDVFRFLAGVAGLHVTTFNVRRPTLNEIFLELYKGQPAPDTGN
jgi:ABC-2 type transport system ATP-binding protein